MDTPFTYGRYVSGKYFLGRKKDVAVLANLVSQKENIVLISPPKGGKTSVLQQVFLNVRLSKKNFLVSELPMSGIRDLDSLLLQLGDAFIRPFASTPTEYRQVIANFLTGTHFVFDERQFSETGNILSLNWDPEDKDIHALLTLPYTISRYEDKQLAVVLREFQNICFIEGWERLVKMMENVMKEQRSMLGENMFSYIMSGSRPNAMSDIFVHHHHFYRLVEIHRLSPIDEKEISESVVKGFLTGGKVVDRQLLSGVITLFKGDMHYINHFFAICDHLSKGYIMESVLNEALANLIAIHESRFEATVEDLTNFQVSLLKAIVDGYDKFSSADVIRSYGLNSSANVKRIKDALAKKEIIIFDDEDHPRFIDPLFEYWIKKYFFRKKLDI